jgi:hypothetical protein
MPVQFADLADNNGKEDTARFFCETGIASYSMQTRSGTATENRK